MSAKQETREAELVKRLRSYQAQDMAVIHWELMRDAATALGRLAKSLAEADAVISDGVEEAQMRDHILSPDEYERFEKAALERHAARHAQREGERQ